MTSTDEDARPAGGDVDGDRPEDGGWRRALEQASRIVLVALAPMVVATIVMLPSSTPVATAQLSVRWSNPAWRALDWFVAVVALVHGFDALRLRLGDRDRRLLGVGFDLGLVVTVLIVTVASATYAVT